MNALTVSPVEKTSDAPDSNPAVGIRSVALGAAVLSLILAFATILAKVFARSTIAVLYDDAFMFQRYADNVLHGYGVTWNPGGAPTYGLTSVFFLVVAIPMRLIAGIGSPGLAQLLSSFVSGVAFLILLNRLVFKSSQATTALKIGVFVVTMFSMATCETSNHFICGMDAPFGMAYLTGYFLLFLRLEDGTASRRRTVLVGLFGALAMGIRPELAIFTVGAPAAMSVLGSTPAARSTGRVLLVTTLAGLTLHLLLARLYFGSALPLPFYAKATGLYGPAIHHVYRGKSTHELILFLGDYWPLFGLIALDFSMGARSWWRNTLPVEKAAVVGVVFLLIYEWLFVLQIMPFDQRFYHPMLPALIFLATRAAARIEKAIGRDVTPSIAALSVLTWFWLMPVFVTSAREATTAAADQRNLHFSHAELAKTTGPQKLWFKIDEMCALPDDVTIATSEVGFISILAPKKQFLDLVGLNDTDIALHGFSNERLFRGGGPDVLYLPHPDYREIIQSILSSPEIDGYDIYTPSTTGALLGVAIKRSSPHYAKMRQIMGNRSTVTPDRYEPSLKIRPHV
jgi:hypothetical protein